MVLIEVRLPEPTRQADSGVAGIVGGYFRSIGVEANSPEEAAAAARHVAVERDEPSGWASPTKYEIGEVEVTAAEGHDTSTVGPDGTFFKSGRIFYPAKRWWEVWK